MATGPAPTVEALQRQVAALSAYAQRLEGQLEGRPAPEDPLPSPLPAEAGDGGRGRTRHGFDRDDLQRYSRQMLLPDWGPLGQQALRAGKVLLVGAGALGCPVALYLAGAGVGTLGCVDPDVVDRSNLHRQVAHCERRQGLPKVLSLKLTCEAINDKVRVVPHQERFTAENGERLVADYDVVVDCSDNITTRYLVSDACVSQGKPLVFGAAVGWDGQVAVYNHEGGACYRCIHPDPPPSRSCDEHGVCGPIPGLVGCLQALEVLKLLTGAGRPLSGWLVAVHGLDQVQVKVRLPPRRPDCVACGQQTRILFHVPEGDCLASAQRGPLNLPAANIVSPEWLAEVRRSAHPRVFDNVDIDVLPYVILDVRPQTQYQLTALPDSTNIPLGDLEQRLGELAALRVSHGQPGSTETGSGERPPKPVYVLCRRGVASRRAVALLLREGWAEVYSVEGGLTKWASSVDVQFPMY
eukprot:EG_transcript_10931